MTASTREPQSRGGAPVGYLSELPPVEMAAIQYLRLWFSGKQDRIWRDFHNGLCQKDAKAAMVSFETLMDIVENHSRRPLLRHSEKCECFGGDECAFAQFVAAASSGNEHDAITFGLHLFKGIRAYRVLKTAAHCGKMFSCMADLDMAQITGLSPIPTHPMPETQQ